MIGAGVAGLTAALKIARAGRRCVIFEAGDRVGGLCATIDDDGIAVEPAASVVIGASTLTAVLAPLGADPRALLARDDPSVRVVSGGRRLDVVGPLARFEQAIGAAAGGDATGVARLLTAAARAADSLPALLTGFKRGRLVERAAAARLLPWLACSYRALLRRSVRDPRVREALEAFAWFYAGVAPARAPAALAIMPALAVTDGCFRVMGGMQALADRLAAAARAAGVEVRLGDRVTRLVARGDAIEAVVSARGALQVEGVVAACDVAATAALVPQWARSLRMRMRLAPMRRSVSCVSVFGRGELAEELPRMTWALADGRPRRLLPFAAIVRAPDGGLRIGGAHAHGPGRRGGVQPPAHELADELTGLVAAAGVHLRFDAARTWTAEDYERRLGLPGGAAFGFEPSRAQLGPGRYGPRTPVPNLVVAGQSCYPAFGIPYSALSGRLAAEVLLA